MIEYPTLVGRQTLPDPTPTHSRQPSRVPATFARITDPLPGRIDRRLGYAGDVRFVAFAYDPRRDDVTWDDGRSVGTGPGAWNTFLYEITPLADLYEVNLASPESVGSHVLVLDRLTRDAYFAPRREALRFVATRGRPGADAAD